MTKYYIIGILFPFVFFINNFFNNKKLSHILSISLASLVLFIFMSFQGEIKNFNFKMEVDQVLIILSMLNVVISFISVLKYKSSNMSVITSFLLYIFGFVREEANFFVVLLAMDLAYFLLIAIRNRVQSEKEVINAILKRELVSIFSYFAMFLVFFQGGYVTVENIQLNFDPKVLAVISILLLLRVFYELYLFGFEGDLRLKKSGGLALLNIELSYQVLVVVLTTKAFKLYFTALPPIFQDKLIGVMSTLICLTILYESIKTFNERNVLEFIDAICSVKKILLLFLIMVMTEIDYLTPNILVTLVVLYTTKAISYRFTERNRFSIFFLFPTAIFLIVYLVFPFAGGSGIMGFLLEKRQYFLMISIIFPNILLLFQLVERLVILSFEQKTDSWQSRNEKIQSKSWRA